MCPRLSLDIKLVIVAEGFLEAKFGCGNKNREPITSQKLSTIFGALQMIF